MNNTRFGWKVGFFVFVGLVMGALLILNFSKGPLVFHSTYKLHITMPTVAGLKPAADVMMAGVPVGKVVATELSLGRPVGGYHGGDPGEVSNSGRGQFSH